jgi:hypothetical protein
MNHGMKYNDVQYYPQAHRLRVGWFIRHYLTT